MTPEQQALIKPLPQLKLHWTDAQSYSPWFYAITEVGKYRCGWLVGVDVAYAGRNGDPMGVFANLQEAQDASQADFDARRQERHASTILAALDLTAFEAAVREKVASVADTLGYCCSGCGHLCGNPIRDLKMIHDAGGISCCPERDMRPLSTAILALIGKGGA